MTWLLAQRFAFSLLMKSDRKINGCEQKMGTHKRWMKASSCYRSDYTIDMFFPLAFCNCGENELLSQSDAKL